MDKEKIIELKNFLPEYLELKGINPDKLFRCFAKNHEDKNPSMGYFDKGKICKCFACDKKYDIFSLIGEEYGLKTFKEQIAKVDELYNNRELIKSANETIYSKKHTLVELDYSKHSYKKQSKSYENDLKMEKQYLKWAEAYFTENIDYLQKRGISEEIIKKRFIGYNKDYKTIIIPVTYKSFTARRIDECKKEDRFRKIGSNKDIFNWFMLNNVDKNIFVVEGEIDALSLMTVGKEALALRSTTNIDSLINLIKEKGKESKYHLMLDNDKEGLIAQNTLYNKLKELDIQVDIVPFPTKYKDINEYLVDDRKGLEDFFDNFHQRMKDTGFSLQYSSKKIKDDKEIAMIGVSRNGLVLQFVSEKLKNDKEVVSEAIKNDERAILFADKQIQNNKETIIELMKENRNIFKYLNSNLQNDKEIITMNAMILKDDKSKKLKTKSKCKQKGMER